MTTISAKELRQNLSAYLQRAMRGEDIEIIYRSKPAVMLSALTPASTQPAKGSAAAFRASMAALEPALSLHHSTLDQDQRMKELYHDLLDHDPKYNPEP